MADNGKRKYYDDRWSPKGVGIYPWLHKADTKYKAEGEYRCKMRWSRELIEQLDKDMLAIAEEFKAWHIAGSPEDKVGLRKNAKVLSSFKSVFDKEGNDTGEAEANFKLAACITYKKDNTKKFQKPKVWDSKGKPTLRSPYTGSILKIVFEPNPYYNAKDNEYGTSLRMKGVQILKIVEGGDANKTAADYGLEVDEDGFSDDGFDATTSDMPPQDGVPAATADDEQGARGNPSDF